MYHVVSYFVSIAISERKMVQFFWGIVWRLQMHFITMEQKNIAYCVLKVLNFIQ